MALLCQAQNFSKNYAVLSDIDSGVKVLPYKTGYLIQFFGQDNSSQNDYYLGLIETDSKGELIQKTIFDSLMADPVILVENDKVTLASSFNHYPPYVKKTYLIQTDPSGLITKQNVINFNTGFHFTKKLEKVDNHYYITDLINYYGDNFNTHTWTSDSIKIVVFDSSFQYQKTINCQFVIPIFYHASTTIHDNNFIVCAFSEQDTLDAKMKYIVLAFDSSGNEKWKYTTNQNVSPFDKVAIETLGYNNKSTAILMPYENDTVIFTQQYIVKLDSIGLKDWAYYDSNNLQEGKQELASIFKTKDENIIAVGQQDFVSKDDNRRTGVILKLDKNGTLKWKRRVWDINTPFGHSGFNGGIELGDGSLLITGWWRDTLPDPYFDTNVWLIKLDSNGCYNPGCTGDDVVASQHNIIVLSKDLLKISPNPAHNQLQCSWTNTPSEARYISVFDMNGVEIIKKSVTGKTGNISIDISNVPAGVYLVKLFGDKWGSWPEKLVKE